MKEHPNYPGYLITENGEVFSCVKKKYGIKGRGTSTYIDYDNPVKLSPYIHPQNGYVYVALGGKYGQKRLHRLVAELFIENPNDLPEVNHIDENKTNNNVRNLEWCSRQKNAEHSLSKTFIVENIKTGEKFEVFNLKKWSLENNLSAGSLQETIHQKRRKQHKGYRLISVV